MKFYDIGMNYENLIKDEICRIFPRVELTYGDGRSEFIPDEDILELEMTSYEESTGGYINKGTLVLSNRGNRYTREKNPELKAGLSIDIHYCMGNQENTYHRFTLYADSQGFQPVAEGRKKTCRVNLVDLSGYLKRSDELKNWTGDETVVHGVICSGLNPEKSLVHILGERVGLKPSDIDCDLLNLEITWVKLTGNVWNELCQLANAVKAHLECGKEKPLTFAYSPYDADYIPDEGASWKLTSDDITEYRIYERTEAYANTLRMKWTRYRETGMTELWHYADPPVTYDDGMHASYPFGNGTRDIEKYPGYEAEYTYRDDDGKTYTVVKALDIDSREMFEACISDTGSCIKVLEYNTEKHPDRALVQLKAEGKTDLKRASIHGNAIIAETNYSHYIRNATGVNEYGTKVLNVTGRYFSETEIDGMPFYKRWALDTLEEKSRMKRGFFIKTNMAIFHARAGAWIEIDLSDTCGVREEKCRITELVLRYRKDAAFETTMTVTT